MVVRVYDFNSREDEWPKEMFCLKDTPHYTEVYVNATDRSGYKHYAVLGDEHYKHVVLSGNVIHRLVRATMESVDKETKMNMISLLNFLLAERKREV
mgnify:FL=1